MSVIRYLYPNKIVPFLTGVLMSINFIVFWSIPIMGMGSLYKQLLKPYLQPWYFWLDSNPTLRSFAANYVYNTPKHADFFALTLLLLLNCSITIPTMFYWQLSTGSLPWWLIFAYYCSWVGIGGSMMGTAYGLAHKEGHMPKLYKSYLHNTLGNVFENSLGCFFGNVPWNFSTSHNKIHHGTNGGVGDTFYLWDFDRSNPCDFMLYVFRITMHMCGYSSIKYFLANGIKDKADLLQQGVYTYLTVGVSVLAITRSFSFFFWFYLQPFLCMTYFLALINIGFHGFLEYDNKGQHIQNIDATCIIEGEDDLFGEDDHNTHHYNLNVYFKDLPEYQHSKEDTFKRDKASIFRHLSIVELSIFIILGLYDKLADHYVDYSGKMTREEIKALLKERVERKELTYEEYQEFLNDPTIEARNKLKLNVKENLSAESQKSG